MTSSLERLRLGIGLIHSVPGGNLRLVGGTHDPIVVSSDPGAGITPCAMRRVVLAAACPTQSNLVGWVEEVEIEGSLRSRGGGLYRCVSNAQEERWFATFLRKERIFTLLDGLNVRGVPDGAICASLRPDSDLGMCSVRLTVNAPCLDQYLDPFSEAARTACMVEELLISASNQASLNGSENEL